MLTLHVESHEMVFKNKFLGMVQVPVQHYEAEVRGWCLSGLITPRAVRTTQALCLALHRRSYPCSCWARRATLTRSAAPWTSPCTGDTTWMSKVGHRCTRRTLASRPRVADATPRACTDSPKVADSDDESGSDAGDSDGESVASSDEDGKKAAPLTPEEMRKAAEEEEKKERAEKESVVIKEGDYQVQVHLIEVRPRALPARLHARQTRHKGRGWSELTHLRYRCHCSVATCTRTR